MTVAAAGELHTPPTATRPRPRLGLQLVVGIVALTIVVVFAAAAPLFGDPYEISRNGLDARGLPVGFGSPGHVLGTDQIGRDLLARLASGARTTLVITSLAATISFVVGASMGLLAGFFRSRWAALLLRVTDLFLAIPTIVLGLALASIVGQGIAGIVIVVTAIYWSWTARLVYGEVLSVRGRAYIEAAEVMGEPRLMILRHHVVPAIGQLLMSVAALNAAGVVGVGSALSFLGAGVQAPRADWGSMLQQSQGALSYAPRLLVLPLVCIVVTVMSFTLIGRALNQRNGARSRARWFDM